MVKTYNQQLVKYTKSQNTLSAVGVKESCKLICMHLQQFRFDEQGFESPKCSFRYLESA